MRPLSGEAPALVDSLSAESFFQTLNSHITVMQNSKIVKDPMIFGETKIAKADYIKALEKIFDHQEDWLTYIKENFTFFEVYGREKWQEALTTGYYEPIVRGALRPSDKFSRAVYMTPPDLVSINLKAFSYKFSREPEHKTLTGRLEGNQVTPYYVRAEIDGQNKLAGKFLELAWLDPIDAFFIQIQGSGYIELAEGGGMRIGYADQNGHPYVALGKHLTHVIPKDEMSMQSIRSYLLGLPKEERQKILNLNPSYVFFKKLESQAITYAGMEVSDGRSIATDKELMPKGALAFLDIEEPVFETASSNKPVAWLKLPRLVFDQDTGGAIKGPGRVDLFFGRGESAEQKAGVMRRMGKLYYLVPKQHLKAEGRK